MSDGTPADVGPADLVHRDRGHHPGRDPGLLGGVLEGQAVHDGGEHADVVAGRTIIRAAAASAAEDVAAADDDPDLDAEGVDLPDLASDERTQNAGSTPYGRSREGLAGQLEEDPPVAHRQAPGGRTGRRVARSSPSA